MPKKPLTKTPSSGVLKKKSATNHKNVPIRRGKEKRTSKISPSLLTAATNTSSPDFIVRGTNNNALFSLTCYRGEGMCLLAMNWKQEAPPNNFVGFAIKFMEPGGTQFYTLPNRIAFPDASGHLNPNTLSSRLSLF
jgi:hypothetical protein